MTFSHKRGIVHIMNLNELTQLIRQEIHRQYRSVRQFALQAGIPLSTVVTALNNDLKGSSYEIVVAMCKVLDIQAVTSDLSVFLDKSRRDLLEGYSRLDDLGRHTVEAVLYVELLRCRQEKEAETPYSAKDMQAVSHRLRSLAMEESQQN